MTFLHSALYLFLAENRMRVLRLYLLRQTDRCKKV